MNKLNSSIISVKDLREHLSEYAEAVSRGRSFTVVRRSKPIFTISPPPGLDEDEQWETVADFTDLPDGGISPEDLKKALADIDD